MKLKTLKIQNFRGYKKEISIDIDDLTVFVGKNDIGKSTVLEALDIFFNDSKGIIKIDKEDVNKTALKEGDNNIIISAIFTDLPKKIIIDSTHETTFSKEYLLNKNGDLEIIKKYPNAGNAKVFIKSNHPTNEKCKDLLLKKLADYKKIITENKIQCENQSINSIMRKSIWDHFSNELQLQEIEIDASKEDAKNIWDKIREYIPIYSLFQSDRKNSDSDNEVQDPLKEAVKQILKDEDIKEKFEYISKKVSNSLLEVSKSTLEKIKQMNPEIANTLNPNIPSNETLKWIDVFKNVSIIGDDCIPINKRGSGVKRLILLNFFRAEAERRAKESERPVIYAVEEPETSQHTDHQKILIRAFKELAETNNTQILLTTHSPIVVKELKFENLRLISNEEHDKIITSIEKNNLPYPSLNEINFIAFRDLTEEYHNELYAYIEAEGLLGSFKRGKQTMVYKKTYKGQEKEENIILSEYIRHQIHHPENSLNIKYTFEQLEESVNLMREFIIDNK
jgi:hypothetical protein